MLDFELREKRCAVQYSFATRVLPELPKKFTKSKEIILKLVQLNPCCIEYMDKSLDGDRDIALAAASTQWESLEYFRETKWLEDEEICRAALRNNGFALKCCFFFCEHSR